MANTEETTSIIFTSEMSSNCSVNISLMKSKVSVDVVDNKGINHRPTETYYMYYR